MVANRGARRPPPPQPPGTVAPRVPPIGAAPPAGDANLQAPPPPSPPAELPVKVQLMIRLSWELVS